MDVTIGFSPCPNDTYMFAALVNQWIDTEGLKFKVVMEDVEKLNEWAAEDLLDVTKMSFHRSLHLEEKYTLLNSGAALGHNCGPLLIAKNALTSEEILSGPVALPGRWTTANLLFDIFYPGCLQKEYHLFSSIEDLILSDRVRAGVIIHENRFTYTSKGLVRLRDLGEAWEQRTGLPIPLGGIFAHKRLAAETRELVDAVIRKSIEFANSNPSLVMPYVRSHAQEMDEDVMMEHIRLYVTGFSISLGKKGQEAIEGLKKAGFSA